MTESTYRSAEELLSTESLDVLSKEAVRLYVKVWNLMAKKNSTAVWLSDNGASISGRVDFDQVPRAKRELVEAGLFTIRPGKWPAEDPPNICNRYEFVPSDSVSA
jgi:hypothetical protein